MEQLFRFCYTRLVFDVAKRCLPFSQVGDMLQEKGKGTSTQEFSMVILNIFENIA